MADVLKMASVNSIVTLIEGGYSDRHIADVLNVDRGTVDRYRRRSQNPPNAPSGSCGGPPGHDGAGRPKPPTGPDSLCEPHRLCQEAH